MEIFFILFFASFFLVNVKSTLMIYILAPLDLPLYLKKITLNSLIKDAECSMPMILRNMSKMCLKDMHAGGFL